jgi:hypothetical protein
MTFVFYGIWYALFMTWDLKLLQHSNSKLLCSRTWDFVLRFINTNDSVEQVASVFSGWRGRKWRQQVLRKCVHLSRNVASHTQERTRSFQAFTLGDLQVVVFWIITTCKRISLFRHFEGTYNLHLQVVAEAIGSHTSHWPAIPAPGTHCWVVTRGPCNFKVVVLMLTDFPSRPKSPTWEICRLCKKMANVGKEEGVDFYRARGKWDVEMRQTGQQTGAPRSTDAEKYRYDHVNLSVGCSGWSVINGEWHVIFVSASLFNNFAWRML